MPRINKKIKKYLESGLNLKNTERTIDCLSERKLLSYMENKLSLEEIVSMDQHISGCGFCLSQLSLASEAENIARNKFLPGPSRRIITKVKNFVMPKKHRISAETSRKRKAKKNLFLALTIVSFTLSFVIHRYFMQFLTGALILGFRWAFESETGRTLIMVLDSWRKHSHDDDKEISRRLRKRF